jgi:hypothetical protein
VKTPICILPPPKKEEPVQIPKPQPPAPKKDITLECTVKEDITPPASDDSDNKFLPSNGDQYQECEPKDTQEDLPKEETQDNVLPSDETQDETQPEQPSEPISQPEPSEAPVAAGPLTDKTIKCKVISLDGHRDQISQLGSKKLLRGR